MTPREANFYAPGEEVTGVGLDLTVRQIRAHCVYEWDRCVTATPDGAEDRIQIKSFDPDGVWLTRDRAGRFARALLTWAGEDA